jgi:hypothetical protein
MRMMRLMRYLETSAASENPGGSVPARTVHHTPDAPHYTDEVLQHYLDLNEAEIAALREAGAIGVKR